MDNPWIEKYTVKTIFLFITTISLKRMIIYRKSSKTQLENEMQNVVASSGGKRHVNASSFSVYGFQCFVYCFPFLFFKTLPYCNQKCAPPSQISLTNFQKCLGIFQIR